MNPFLVLLSLLAGAVISWLLVVRRVTVEVPSIRPVGDAVADAAVAAGGAVAAGRVRPADRGRHTDPADYAHYADEPTDYVGEPTAYTQAPTAPVEPAASGGLGAHRVPDSVPVPADGGVPEGYTVKGDTVARLYLLPSDRDFGRARPDIWFIDEFAALAAGYNHFDRTPAEPAAD